MEYIKPLFFLSLFLIEAWLIGRHWRNKEYEKMTIAIGCALMLLLILASYILTINIENHIYI